MTAFAAGCAVCGFDLEAHRAQQATRRVNPAAIRTPSLPRAGISDDALAVLVTAVAALFFPLLALGIALLMMRNPSRANVRTPLIVLAGLSLLMLLVPTLRYGVLALAYG